MDSRTGSSSVNRNRYTCALPALIATDTPAPSIGSSQKEEPIFPAEAIEELKKHIIVFTGAGMMLSVFAAVGGFLLGRRTKEC